MFENEAKINKTKIDVEFEFDDGRSMMGWLFVTQRQRVSDLLNDDRIFLPILTTAGSIINIRKTLISKVTQLNQRVDSSVLSDPYEVLGVPTTASNADLKEAHRRKSSEFHPDKILGMGLPVEFIDFANLKMAMINDAYSRIREKRKDNTDA